MSCKTCSSKTDGSPKGVKIMEHAEQTAVISLQFLIGFQT